MGQLNCGNCTCGGKDTEKILEISLRHEELIKEF